MCERKCICGSCEYCYERDRYEREKPLRLHRSRIRALQEKYLLESSNKFLDDFIAGRISLHDFEVELNVN